MSALLPPVALSKATLASWLGDNAAYERMLDAFAMNARMGPFKATSGLQLAYLMAAMTSLLDPEPASLLANGDAPLCFFSWEHTPTHFYSCN